MVFDDYKGPIKRCEACGKLCFTSRKRAKSYMHHRFPKEKMTVYRCRDNPAYFHYGHTPWSVKKGRRARDQVRAS